MSSKLDLLERTVLELGTEIYRVKHRMDLIEKENTYYQEVFVTLRKMFDEKGILSLEEFDESVHLDRILRKQASSNADILPFTNDADVKKAIN
ncbi:MAG: hypothetical protein NT027_15300 [Proteobacteria bacterium]|nr:hypothetical protein [Pseudomonadota bacterium]